MVTEIGSVTKHFPPATESFQERTAELVKRAKKGDGQACFELFETHNKRVYSLTLQLTADVAAAENLTQNIFIETFRGLESVCDDTEFANALYRRTANAALLWHARHVAMHESATGSAAIPAPLAESQASAISGGCEL